MSVWAIIPIKPLRLAKSRLSAIVTPEGREKLAEVMLRHTLKVVQSVAEVTGMLVVSRDNHALTIAREYGAKTIQESGTPALNEALERATSVVASWRSDAILVLPADLPLLSPEDIKEIIHMGQIDRPCVVLSTDRNRDGTNAFYIQPPGLIRYAYGEGSFQAHAVLARDAGAEVLMYESERMVQDIDLPEDIENYIRIIQRLDGDSIAHLPLDELHLLNRKLDT
ncbi:MAG: 2-phospho-L-lactate guanylyltransferase [Phototrophicales bacterium]|nr:2-phospho-L-lactate guanylyltransferase [Phototrophicales bacterium]